jgi:hypothetical protein
MSESPVSTYQKIINVLGDLRVIAWAVALLIFIIGGIFWLPYSFITFLLGVVLTLGLLGTIVYLTLAHERPTESIGKEIKRLTDNEGTQGQPKGDRLSLERPKDVTRFHVLTEVDTESRPSNTGRQLQSNVAIIYDALDKSRPLDKFLMVADLRVRFDGQDPLAGRVQRIAVFLRREVKGEIKQAEVEYSATDEATRAEQSLIDLPIPHGLTRYYRLDCQAELEKGWANLLDDHCFLRVVTEAKDQPPYCVDLNVEWGIARTFDCVAALSPRRSGPCS